MQKIQISTASQLQQIPPDAHIYLKNSINCSTLTPLPLFQGIIDGCGYQLTDLSNHFIDTLECGILKNIRFSSPKSLVRVSKFSKFQNIFSLQKSIFSFSTDDESSQFIEVFSKSNYIVQNSLNSKFTNCDYTGELCEKSSEVIEEAKEQLPIALQIAKMNGKFEFAIWKIQRQLDLIIQKLNQKSLPEITKSVENICTQRQLSGQLTERKTNLNLKPSIEVETLAEKVAILTENQQKLEDLSLKTSIILEQLSDETDGDILISSYINFAQIAFQERKMHIVKNLLFNSQKSSFVMLQRTDAHTACLNGEKLSENEVLTAHLTDCLGLTAMHYAVILNKQQIVKQCLSNAQCVRNTNCNFSGLMIAAMMGNLDLVNLLKGVEGGVRNQEGNTAYYLTDDDNEEVRGVLNGVSGEVD